jgi:hypothetical protein
LPISQEAAHHLAVIRLGGRGSLKQKNPAAEWKQAFFFPSE